MDKNKLKVIGAKPECVEEARLAIIIAPTLNTLNTAKHKAIFLAVVSILQLCIAII